MRYYQVDIIGAPTPPFPSPGFGYPFTVQGPSAQWRSTAPDGTNDPGAQQIEFQIEEYPATDGGTPSSLTIFGVSFEQMRSSDALVGKIIYVYGGMHSKSLPLSNVAAKRPVGSTMTKHDNTPGSSNVGRGKPSRRARKLTYKQKLAALARSSRKP